MNNSDLFKKIENILYATQFVCLIFFQFCSAANLTDLLMVCDVRDSQTFGSMSNLPAVCTAAGTSTTDIGVLDRIAQENKTIPIILKVDAFNYLQWGDHLHQPDAFIRLMEEENLDGLIFNYMYKVDHFDPSYDEQRNWRIYYFIQYIKEMKPEGLFGLALPRQATLLPIAFNYGLLDQVFDFYLIKTINYRKCHWAITMSRSTTVGDMRKSLNSVPNSVPKSKILLTVQLYSEGVLPFGYIEPAMITYSEMCGQKDLSNNRKYCKDSLKSLWEKAQLCYEYGLLGTYVEHGDYDDINGLCNCENGENGNTVFPGLAAISSGSQNQNNINLNCKDFGDMYDD